MMQLIVDLHTMSFITKPAFPSPSLPWILTFENWKKEGLLATPRP